MEKLQKALSKARAERGGKGGRSSSMRRHGISGPNARKAADPSVDFPDIWTALTPFDPDPGFLLRNRVMTLNAQADGGGGFDLLRTKIFLMMEQNGWTRMAITSPGASCGKTTTACNLSVGFSRQKEVKTMLFDFDLRRHGIAKMLGHQPEHDIAELLRGKVTPEQQMVRLRDNVAISMANNPVPDSSQLLLSSNTTATLDTVQKQFEPDLMIFDLPPMLVTDDARAILNNVDCALIVAYAEKTKTSQLDVCEREVSEHTNVLGVVLNNCRHMEQEQDDYGYYG